jgi:hypothetical protein
LGDLRDLGDWDSEDSPKSPKSPKSSETILQGRFAAGGNGALPNNRETKPEAQATPLANKGGKRKGDFGDSQDLGELAEAKEASEFVKLKGSRNNALPRPNKS